jgi:hypothetical protein
MVRQVDIPSGGELWARRIPPFRAASLGSGNTLDDDGPVRCNKASHEQEFDDDVK